MPHVYLAELSDPVATATLPRVAATYDATYDAYRVPERPDPTR
ncbi:hypothetical protein [Streptomyces dioscori]|nr:hypothetical protein [Streptomyces dioscori]